MLQFITSITDNIAGFISGIKRFIDGIGFVFNALSNFTVSFAGFFPAYVILIMQAIFFFGLTNIIIICAMKIINVVTLGLGGNS